MNQLASIWDLLDGKKTYIASFLALLIAANEAAMQVFQVTLLPGHWQAIVMMLATAAGVVGIGHKLDKARQPMQDVAVGVEAIRALYDIVTTDEAKQPNAPEATPAK